MIWHKDEEEISQIQEMGDIKLGIRFGWNENLTTQVGCVSVLYTHVIC